MGLFGWSYPPGCSGTPYDESYPCDVCGKYDDACICPECPVCSTHGEPRCYKEHGLVRTQEQIDSLAAFEKAREEEAEMERKYYEEGGFYDRKTTDQNS